MTCFRLYVTPSMTERVISARVEPSVNPKNAPRALASGYGHRSPDS